MGRKAKFSLWSFQFALETMLIGCPAWTGHCRLNIAGCVALSWEKKSACRIIGKGSLWSSSLKTISQSSQPNPSPVQSAVVSANYESDSTATKVTSMPELTTILSKSSSAWNQTLPEWTNSSSVTRLPSEVTPNLSNDSASAGLQKSIFCARSLFVVIANRGLAGS